MLNALVVERGSLLDDCFQWSIELQAIAGGLVVLIAMTSSAILNQLWPQSRIGVLGAPILSGVVAAPASWLLLLSCGAQLEMDEATGAIIWPPVASCAVVGLGVGVIMTCAVGLMRSGGRAA